LTQEPMKPVELSWKWVKVEQQRSVYVKKLNSCYINDSKASFAIDIQNSCGTENFLKFELKRTDPKFSHCLVDKVCPKHKTHDGDQKIIKNTKKEEDDLFFYESHVLVRRITDQDIVARYCYLVSVDLGFPCWGSCNTSSCSDIMGPVITKERARDLSLQVTFVSAGIVKATTNIPVWIKTWKHDDIQKSEKRMLKGSARQIMNKRKLETQYKEKNTDPNPKQSRITADNTIDIDNLCSKIRSGLIPEDLIQKLEHSISIHRLANNNIEVKEEEPCEVVNVQVLDDGEYQLFQISNDSQ